MTYLLYACAAISALLAVGGLASRHPGLLAGSIASLIGATTAVALASWWPLAISFALQFLIRAVLGSPETRR